MGNKYTKICIGPQVIILQNRGSSRNFPFSLWATRNWLCRLNRLDCNWPMISVGMFFFGGCKPWSTAVHRFYFAFGRLFGQKAWHEAWVVCAGLSAVKLILLILQLHCVGYVRCKFSNRSWRRATLCNQVQKMQHLSLQIAVLTRMSIACQSTKVAQPWRQTW